MPQNNIQFQRGVSLSKFIERYGTEIQCEAALAKARWPTGFVCPKCGEREHSRFLVDGRWYWHCTHCRAQTTVRFGTLFHTSRLPLTKWFQAIYTDHPEQEPHLGPVAQAPPRRLLLHGLEGQAQAARSHAPARGPAAPARRGRRR